jgi:DNA-binding NarL/FixJ family response regulator
VTDPADVASDLITIVLADDHALVRSGLRRLLELEDDFRVVAEAGDANAALSVTRDHRPKVVLLDLNMPGPSSLETIPNLLEASPGAAVVVLTMHDVTDYAREALAAGASAYVLKDAADRELVEAVRAVVAGRNYLDPGLGARLARAVLSQPSAPRAGAAPAGELEIGATFAGHRIEAVAGRGGMGIVFRATDLVLGRPVALKVIAPAFSADPVFRARFEQECRLAASIDHPHAVDVFHAGEEDGRLYVTMRFVPGTDLKALLKEEGKLDVDRALRIVTHVAGALDAAHRHGLVHRDVKPANVLIAPREGEEHAFLTDFGLTKQRSVDTELTGTGLAIGTADYMAPEQAQGLEIDGRADVYALGCVLFQTLTGAVPYATDSDLEKMWAHVHQAPPDLLRTRPDLPAELGDVIARAMAKHRDDRQGTAGELAREALAAVG